MANNPARTGNNYPNGAFNPVIWSKLLNSKYYAQCFLMSICNSKWEGEIKTAGGSVMIRNRPTVLITDGVVNADVQYQDVTDESIELLINKILQFAIRRDDVDKVQSDIDALSELTQDASYNMKIETEKLVLGSIYSDAGTSMSSVTIDKTNVLDWIIDQEVIMEEKNLPVTDRWLVIPPKVAGYIQKSDLKNASLTGDSTSVVRKNMTNGRLGEIGGLTLYVSNNLANAGTTYHCVSGHKSAVTFASQLVNVEKLRLQTKFGDAVRGQNLFGFKTVLPDGLIHAPVVAV
jgi:hypothetical protein